MKTIIQYILVTIILFSFKGFSQNPGEIKEDNKGSFVEFKLSDLNDLNNWNNLFNEKEEIKKKQYQY